MNTLPSNTADNGELLLSRLTEFVRYARNQEFRIGMQETLDSQRLALRIGITHRRQLRQGLKSLLCTSASDWERFDAMFDQFWKTGRTGRNSFVSRGGQTPRLDALTSAAEKAANTLFDIADARALDATAAGESDMQQGGASAAESIGSQNFEQISNADELRKMEALAERLARRIRQRLQRRYRSEVRGEGVDMRRTVRTSLRYGGLPLQLMYRKRRQQVPKIVLLLDVSRSMSVYSYMFLRFVRGMLGAFKDADAFAFHIRLIHIGEAMREPSQHKLREKMALISAGWSGGTRIDKSLESFNRHYARNILNSRSIVIVVSDGYDTGEPQSLVTQLQRIKRRARRLIWLNPLLGQASYEPITRCMQAALPLLDVFAAAHNLESLAALEDHLAG